MLTKYGSRAKFQAKLNFKQAKQKLMVATNQKINKQIKKHPLANGQFKPTAMSNNLLPLQQ